MLKTKKEKIGNPQIVYLVKGFTGEYEDSTDWVAKAFHTKAEAKAFLAKLLVVVRKYGPGIEGSLDIDTRADFESELGEIDSKCRIDYNGVYYEIEEVVISD